MARHRASAFKRGKQWKVQPRVQTPALSQTQEKGSAFVDTENCESIQNWVIVRDILGTRFVPVPDSDLEDVISGLTRGVVSPQLSENFLESGGDGGSVVGIARGLFRSLMVAPYIAALSWLEVEIAVILRRI